MTLKHRRRFLLVTAGIGISAGWGRMADLRRRRGDELTTIDSGVGDPDKAPLTRFARAFGAQISLTIAHPDRRLALVAAEEVMEEVKLVDRLMSVHQPDSQLSQLNRAGQLDAPHPYLVEAFSAAATISGRTAGAFDITVQPLWELYKRAAEKNCLPSPAAIDDARRHVGWRRVEWGPSSVRLRGPGTAITLNGIAQGLAADKAAVLLSRRGIRHARIDTGEIGTLGTRHGGDGWTIGIQHPRRERAFISLAKLAGRCLATSGDYATRFSADYRHHHLLDPLTGRSPQKIASVSVVAASALDADALSTAVFVMGADRGLELIRSLPKADALLVLKDGTVQVTDGFPLAWAARSRVRLGDRDSVEGVE